MSLPIGTSEALKVDVLAQLQNRAAIDLGDFFAGRDHARNVKA
jgi:hypothetical protein